MKIWVSFFVSALVLTQALGHVITPEQAADLEEVLGDNFALLKDAEVFDWDKLQGDAFAEIDEQDWSWKEVAKNEVRARVSEAKADAEKLAELNAPALLQTSSDVEAEIKEEIANDADIQALVTAKDFDKLEAAAMAKIDAESWGQEEKDRARKEVKEHIAVERQEGDGAAALLQEAQITPEQAAELERVLGDNFELLKDAEKFDWDKLQADAFAEIDEQDWDWKELAKNEVRTRMAEAKADAAKLAALKAPALLQTSNDVEAEIKEEIANDADIQALVTAKDFDKLEATAMAKIDAESWDQEEKDLAKKEVKDHIAVERKEGDGALDEDLEFLFE